MTPFRAAKFPEYGVNIAAHNAMAALLRTDPGNAFALAPFAPILIDDEWRIAACYGAIDDFDAPMVLIDGKTGAMTYADDDKAVGFWGDVPATGKLRIYSNGVIMARDWVASRQATIERLRKISTSGFDATREASHMPGLAMIGDLARIGNFADIITAQSIEIDNPRLRIPLADSILRAARLPVVTAAPPNLRAIV